uniref:Uncharacterized protein n=1 Tax=Siphoviridae sp. ctqBc4 TaxID=2827945 RepID=A0A8S5SCE0_9CAUD|nr:MAG TPA: hypothetical protein [Siphoviridae sp. ctqBc4]
MVSHNPQDASHLFSVCCTKFRHRATAVSVRSRGRASFG